MIITHQTIICYFFILHCLFISPIWCQSTFTVHVGVSSIVVDSSYNQSISVRSSAATITQIQNNLPAWHFHNFYPSALTANIGDTIVFQFNTNIRHSVTYLSGNAKPQLRSSSTSAYDVSAFPMLSNPLHNFTGASCSSGYVTQQELIDATGADTYTIQLDGSLSTSTPYVFYDVFAPQLMNFTLTVQPPLSPQLSPAVVDADAQATMADHLAQASAQDVAQSLNPRPLNPNNTVINNEDNTKTWIVRCGNSNLLRAINGVYLRFYPQRLTLSLGDYVRFIHDPISTAVYSAHHNIVFNGSTTDGTINFPADNTVITASNPNALFDDADNVISSTSRTYRSVHRYPYMGALGTATLSAVYYGSGAIASGFPVYNSDGSITSYTSSYTLQFAIPGSYPFISLLYAHAGMTGNIDVLPTWTKLSTSPREYRSLSGFGNSEKYPLLGQAGTRTQRFGRSYYSGGPSSNAYRTAVSGNPLPAGRNISNSIFSKQYRMNRRTTSDMHTYYAMFLNSDITLVGYRGAGAPTTAFNNPVPAGDLFFDPGNTGTVTLPFTRWLGSPGTGSDQVNDPAIYTNANTGFLDLSGIYGMTAQPKPSSGSVQSNAQTANSIRTFVGGKLCIECFYTSRQLVPDQDKFMPGGDARINQTPAVFSLSMVWRLEHNRLADEFAAANPTWDDERLFQEARRMNIAFYQKITSREYLATLIGFPLSPYTGYKPTQDPSLYLENAVAAARYGHGEVLETIWRRTANGDIIDEGDLTTSQCIFRTQSVVSPGNPGIEPILWGLMAQKQGRASVRFHDVVRNMPFQGVLPTKSPSQDLLAINVARGRDTGLPSYTRMRQIIGLPNITSFSQISTNPTIVADLEAMYESVDDIDLIVGGLAEDELFGANVGPLFARMLRSQFQAIRDGDRFWFENPDYFTPNETAAVYATNFSMILARNTLVLGEKTNQISDLLPANPFFTQSSDLRYIAAHNSKITSSSSTYTNSLQLHSLFLISWSIISTGTGYKDTLSMELRVQNAGWVGIGVDPDPNTMKGADTVLCTWNNGVASIVDGFARDVGTPASDVSLGGTDDLFDKNAFNETSNGKIVQVFQFKRKLDTGDSKDKVLTSSNLHLIWAFHPDSYTTFYHGPSRSSAQYVNLMQLPPSLITLQEDSKAVMIAIAVISGILILFPVIIIALVIIRRNDVRIRAATFIFCILIPVGAIFAYVAVIMANLNKSVETCMLYYWFGSVAYVLVFGSILSKTWRITRIFQTTAPERKLQKVIITTTTLIVYLLVFLAAECILLAVWHSVDPMSPRYVIPDNNSSVANLTCVSNSDVYMWIWIILKLVCLIFGSYLSHSVRGVENALFNESGGMSQSIYVTTVVGGVCLIFGFSLRSQQNTSIIIQSVGLIFPFTYTLISQFAPKFDSGRSTEKAYHVATAMNNNSVLNNASMLGGPPAPLNRELTPTRGNNVAGAVSPNSPPHGAGNSGMHMTGGGTPQASNSNSPLLTAQRQMPHVQNLRLNAAVNAAAANNGVDPPSKLFTRSEHSSRIISKQMNEIDHHDSPQLNNLNSPNNE